MCFMLFVGNFMLLCLFYVLLELILQVQICAGANMYAFCMSGRRIFLSHIFFSDNGNTKVGRQCVVIQSCRSKKITSKKYPASYLPSNGEGQFPNQTVFENGTVFPPLISGRSFLLIGEE